MMKENLFTAFDEELNDALQWDEPFDETAEAELDRDETDLYQFVEKLHHHLMTGHALTPWQLEELGRLLLLQKMTVSEVSRANSLGEPPESILGMAAAKVVDKLPEKIGPAPVQQGQQGWLNKAVYIGPPRAAATNARHIRNYLHACINSILKDEYDRKLKFLGLPDSRQAKRLGISEKPDLVPGSMWVDDGEAILPLEAMSGIAPSPEDVLCSVGCSDAFYALAGLKHKPEFILFYLYRHLGYPPREQILLFRSIAPEEALRRADEAIRQCCPSLRPDWLLPLKARLAADWSVPLTTDTISTGISRVKKTVEKHQIPWSVVA